MPFTFSTRPIATKGRAGLAGRWSAQEADARGQGLTVFGVEGVREQIHMAMGVMLHSVAMTSRAMAHAVFNESQNHVPYNKGTLYDSGSVEGEGFGWELERVTSSMAAIVNVGGLQANVVPDSISADDVLAKYESLGFTAEESKEISSYHVTYSAEHAVIVHEGFIRGGLAAEFQQGKGPRGEYVKWSHFLARALSKMQDRSPALMTGVLQTAMLRVAMSAAKQAARDGAASAAFVAATKKGALGTVGGPRLVKGTKR